jgi:hypothetical protein
MSEDKLPIKNVPEALLAMVVEVSAKQDALMNLIIDYLKKKGESDQELTDTYYADYEASKEELMNRLYAEYGDTPSLNSILEWDES